MAQKVWSFGRRSITESVEPVDASPATPATPLRARFLRLAHRLGIVAAVALLLTAVILLAFRGLYNGKIYPSVIVADMDIGGSSRSAAAETINARSESLNQDGLTFSYQGQTWSPTLAEIGVTFDTQASIDEAFARGREGKPLDRVNSTLDLVQNDQVVPLKVALNQDMLNAWFDSVDADLGLPPHDAYINVDGTNVLIVEEVDGVYVDRPEATTLLLTTIQELRPTDTELPIVSVPVRVRAGDLADAKADLEAALSEPVTIVHVGQEYVLDPADLGTFVVQVSDQSKSGKDAVLLSLDQVGLAKWLNGQLADAINSPPVDAVVGWNDGLVALEPSYDGIKLRPKTLAEDVSASFFGDHEPVKAAVSVITPDVDSDNLEALGITTRLGIGDSSFAGSKEDRETNIQIGAAELNGTLIPPGKEFSFNRAVGVINAEKGFVEATVVQNERIGRDIGGGICQVSTTVFRAALTSGMPITEWWPHRYRLGFYELDGWTPGLDASILQPEGDPFSGGDFKFRNPTDSWMLVESYTNGTNVYVIIYGPETGYTVSLDGPNVMEAIPPTEDLEIVDEELPAGTITQTELKQEGLNVSYTRTIYDANGDVEVLDEWDTHFYPRGNVWKVSPDMEGQSPGA